MVDVLILGAGPAGCELSRRLDSRFSVTIIDRNEMPRNKPCGGILIEESVKFLEPLAPPSGIYVKPKHLDLIYNDWDNNIEFKQNRDFQNIDRKKFDYWLFKQTNKKSNFLRGVIKQVSKNKKFVVTLVTEEGDRKINSDILIDASGAFAISKGSQALRPNTYTAVQFKLSDQRQTEDFEYILSNEISDYYSWVVSKDETVFVGSCFRQENIREKISTFKDLLTKRKGFTFDDAVVESAPIFRPLSVNDLTLIRNAIFVVGEAAGLTSPSTGEGISYALRSAEACANALNENQELTEAQRCYIHYSSPLIDELKNKIERAKIFMDPKRRKMALGQLRSSN